jgi:hypothetical protein
MKYLPIEVYNDAMRRVLTAVRRGDRKDAAHWTSIAERAHRMSDWRNDSWRKQHKHELEAEERKLRIAALKKAAAKPRYD